MREKYIKIPPKIFKQLPKAELHRHLDGSVRPSTVLELAHEQDVKLPCDDLKSLEKLLVVRPDCKDLVEYLRAFDITLSVLQRSYALKRVMFEVCEDAVHDNVRYLEVRFAPILHMKLGLSGSEIMEAVCEAAVQAELCLPITVRIIVCGMRQLSSQQTSSIAEIAWRYKDRGVVAFDLAGPEYGFPSRDHKEAFETLREKLINCTIHSGEAFGPESIRDAIRFCGAQRIGHGVRLREDAELFRFVLNREIPLEMCITSNIQTKAVQSLRLHPFAEYLRKGIVVCACTDNTTVSNVTLSDEISLVTETFKLVPSEILRVIDNGFKSGFIEKSRRTVLRLVALRDAIKVLSSIEGVEASHLIQQFKLDPIIGEDLVYSVSALSSSHPQESIDVKEVKGDSESDVSQEEVEEPVEEHSKESPIKCTPKFQYYNRHHNPILSEEIIRSLPKADTHVRLDSCISESFVWKQVLKDRAFFKSNGLPDHIDSLEKLSKIFSPASTTVSQQKMCKRILKTALQTQEQLQDAVYDVKEQLVRDNVVYAEMYIRPAAHTARSLTLQQVVEVVTVACNDASDEQITLRVVLFASSKEDDPIVFYNTARLCVDYRCLGVIGFASLGGDLNDDTLKYFSTTFNYLKDTSTHVVMSAGRKDAKCIRSALHAGGAIRLSSPYSLHKDPELINYLAVHRIPIELAHTQHQKRHTKETKSFTPAVTRLYFDNDLCVVINSIARTLTGSDLSQTLLTTVQDCHFSAADLLHIISNGFRSAFTERTDAMKYLEDFWTKSVDILHEHGFKFLKKQAWFPVLTPADVKQIKPIDEKEEEIKL
ncbi:Probable adenosine deaminase [Aduncisulcus paluster]|uniref:adenosine deaminase n=1 Tax=Aduncisulcus paluster TaxID=2918883 RepID=A0ABQ5JRZ4_9EUKA|nr:Probable adenosine deaminase [Aduncisulcus paluster]|eukprot:gnl/Carplike_NY0171/1213_a1635_703.p1 GENE.gnl/Carplike_NY0171/1213_a1635_703~~gnl/Carplike_NY0171/1213_a1635_703.p1  ORF type:complete len:822 (+),score=249.08 gnl/Carplike_NY0171/1213_a1635_703:2-2467(+)